MNFVRIFVGKKTGVIRAVMEQDTPFERASIEDGFEELEVHDVGFVEAHTWTAHAPGEPHHGQRTVLSHHIWSRIGHHEPQHSLTLEQARDVLRAHPEMPTFHETPCSLDGIKALLRAKGPAAVPEKVRVWLNLAMDRDAVRACGLDAGVKVSALLVAARSHALQDPNGAHRAARLERVARERLSRHRARQVALRLTQKGE